MKKPLEIVILGGGTAGWMSAAALVGMIGSHACKVTLVESEEIGTIGVGEATLPQIRDFNNQLGIDELDMMFATKATFKVGIEFSGWGSEKSRYIHPFGKFGEPIGGVDFHQVWSQLHKKYLCNELERYSYAVQSCMANKFSYPNNDQSSIDSTFSYAYHFDASLYAQFLRDYAEKRGVSRVEGKLVSVQKNQVTGNINSITLENGRKLTGDFFIDCSGFKSLLLKDNLDAAFEDWSQWLLCDRAVAMPTGISQSLPPFTKSIAKGAGWQWQIPLQHRTGTGFVYCSSMISDDAAIGELALASGSNSQPTMKPIRFKAGRYKEAWIKNCVAIGLASGFLEPLESTSIYLIQVAILNFIKLLPVSGEYSNSAKEFNRRMDVEYERIRDFLILHYHVNKRDDSELWRYCRNMSVPDSLLEKIHLFEHRGYIESYQHGLFGVASWLSVFNGQGLRQNGTDPYASRLTDSVAEKKLISISTAIDEKLKASISHKDMIANLYSLSKNGGAK